VKIWLFLKCLQFLNSYVQFLMDTILNPAIAQFLMKKKGDTLSVRVSHILVKGDAPMKRASRILINEDAHCGGASPFYFICKKIPTNYSPWDSPCTNTQHELWHTYAHVCVPMVTLQAWCKKHHVEHKLCDIFKALSLS
jgi:hypothetical protein